MPASRAISSKGLSSRAASVVTRSRAACPIRLMVSSTRPAPRRARAEQARAGGELQGALDQAAVHVVRDEAHAEVEDRGLLEGRGVLVGVEGAEHEVPGAVGGDGQGGVLIGELAGGLKYGGHASFNCALAKRPKARSRPSRARRGASPNRNLFCCLSLIHASEGSALLSL